MKVHISVLREYLAEHALDFLFENRVDDAREKYPDIEDDVWDSLVANQPAGSNNKYLQWSAKQVDDGTMPEEIVMAIRLFHDNVQRLKQKDINQYADVDALNVAIDELHKNKTKSQEAKQAKTDTQTVYNDETWLVVRPFTTEASQKYGAGSKWCISATQSRNYFNQYSVNNNKFYFVIDKRATDNSANSKYAIAIVATGLAAAGREIQVYDATDKLVPIATVAKHVGAKWPDIWEKIQEHVKANPKTREVEDAEKASEEHVKALLKGEKLSEAGLKKVAKDGKLTTPVVKAILAHYKDYTGPTDYRDTRTDIMRLLSERASDMPGDAALLVMKWIGSTKPDDGSNYWSNKWHLDAMFRNANLSPENFRELAVGASEEVLANIFANPSAPAELKAGIAGKVQEFKDAEAQRKILWELIKSGKINVEQMRLAMSVKKPGEYNYLASQILQHPTEVNIAPELIRLIPVKGAQEFKQLLQIPNLPPDYAGEALAKLMSSGQLPKKDLYLILRTVPLDTPQIEKLWAEKPSPDVRTALLQNPGIGATNASKFAKSKNSAYRFAIAHNTIASPEDLASLANDESVSTRGAVAANPKASAELLTKLAKDEATAVRASVASNASAPQTVLQGLKRDSDSYVRKSAIKTLKSLNRTEALVRHLMGMGGLLNEELTDDDDFDIMNPSWRELPSRGIETYEFISVFLLQNNGSASREEIQEAYQDWTGAAGHKELWTSNRYSDDVIRGLTAGGKGWYWAPPGINKGALFRLTPTGAAGAIDVLKQHAYRANTITTQINSSHAKPGKTYYTQVANELALDITGYERGTLTVEEVLANSQGAPSIDHLGKYTKLNPNRSRKSRWRQKDVKVFKYTSPAGEVKHVTSFPKANLPRNTAVIFIKSMYGMPGSGSHDRGQANLAIVRHGEKFLLIPFPLWAESEGATPRERERNVAPPVKKSPAAAAPAPATAAEPGAAAAPRGPKTTYKIYGKFKGHPVATRLKGQAYVGPADTQFAGGEQAVISPEDGKLRVKKADGDHSQLWEPVDG